MGGIISSDVLMIPEVKNSHNVFRINVNGSTSGRYLEELGLTVGFRV